MKKTKPMTRRAKAWLRSALQQPAHWLFLGLLMPLIPLSVEAQRAVSTHNALPKSYFNHGGFIFVDSQVFDDSVNVGIGITQPQEKLHVQGNILSAGAIISQAPQGTAPVQATSNTLCSSLNSDYLDGLHASDFSLQNHTHPDMLTGTGIPTRVAFYGTSGSLSCSSALYWDNPRQRLGVGTDQPGTSLHLSSSDTTPALRFTENYIHSHFGPTQSNWDLLTQMGQFKLNRIANNAVQNILSISASTTNSVMTLNGTFSARRLQITQGATANYLLTCDASGNLMFKNPLFLTGWTVSGMNVYKTNGVASVGTTATDAMFNIATTGKPALIMNITQSPNGYGLLAQASATSKALAIESDGAERLIIRGDGYLTVDNKIRAKEVEVLVDVWQDRVFGDDYPLLSLHELESYIQQHHHLPEVPAEAEVLQQGISLGVMNSLLLQKVEELTLYLIDMNKKTDALQQEVDRLRSGQKP